MYRLRAEDYVKNRFVGLWSVLAFQAGFINSIGFLAFHKFVSHMTGYGSQIGINLGRGEKLIALETLSAPIAFVLGAWFSGCLTVARSARGERPIFLGALLVAGENGLFGEFGEPLVFTRDFLFLATLSFVCGMQNACFATLTKGQIRTTHLTGISTDFGTDLALITSGNLSDPELRMARRRNFMRFMTFFSFTFGAILSALVDSQLKFMALAVPCITSTLVAFVFFKVKFEIDSGNSQPQPILASPQR
jgi:uncharacterized membrane protein YoaK (UPF0700 family)